MGHSDGPQCEFEEIARLHEVIGILVGHVCEGVMQLVSAAKVCERDHTRQERDAAPPEVCASRASKMSVNTLVSHHCAEEDQVCPHQNIDYQMKTVDHRNEQRTNREQANDADECAVEVVDLRSADVHSVRLTARGVAYNYNCGS